jgi:hypothetical protein
MCPHHILLDGTDFKGHFFLQKPIFYVLRLANSDQRDGCQDRLKRLPHRNEFFTSRVSDRAGLTLERITFMALNVARGSRGIRLGLALAYTTPVFNRSKSCMYCGIVYTYADQHFHVLIRGDKPEDDATNTLILEERHYLPHHVVSVGNISLP